MPTARTPIEQAESTFERPLALTPEPSPGLDASDIVAQASCLMSERETEITILKMLLRENTELLRGNEKCRAIRDLLSLRDRQWGSELDRARGEMSRRRLAGQRARQAQRAYQDSSR
jgi:hypothetical protein